jgi:hypothetical protein
MRLALAVTAVAALARVAAADPPGMTPVTPLAEPAQPTPSPENGRSPLLGTALAVAGTVAPIAVLAMATNESSSNQDHAVLAFTVTAVLAPSAGHWYAGELGGVGLGIRAAGAVLFISAVAKADAGADASTEGWLSLGILAGGAIYDIATSGDAVRDWNKKHAVRVQPAMMKIDHGYGVGLGGSF